MKQIAYPAIIVLDLEATMRTHDIIEIGAVKLCRNNKSYRIGKTFHTYVRPTPLSKLDKHTTELTGITRDNILDAPCFHKAIQQLIDWIGDQEFYFCTWSETDITFLQKACEKHRRKLDWIQNYNDLQAIFGHKYHKGEPNQIGLLAAMEEAGVTPSGHHHSAIFDAENTAKIFLNKLSIQDLLKSQTLVDAFDNMDRIRFGYEKRKQERETLANSEYRKLIVKIRKGRKQLYGDYQAFALATSISSKRLRKIEHFERVASTYEIKRMLQTISNVKQAT